MLCNRNSRILINVIIITLEEKWERKAGKLIQIFFWDAVLEVVVAVAQSLSFVQLYDPMDCSTPGSSVLHYLPEFAQIR